MSSSILCLIWNSQVSKVDYWHQIGLFDKGDTLFGISIIIIVGPWIMYIWIVKFYWQEIKYNNVYELLKEFTGSKRIH